MTTHNSEFEKIKTEAEDFYASVNSINCPALQAKIHFTSEGFNHLKYSKKKARPQAIQLNKFRLLQKSKLLLEKTTTIQEYSERHEEIHKKRHKKVSKEWSPVGYWGFIGIINGTRLKVVIRRIENGKFIFWSVIPTWQTKTLHGTKITDRSKGDLAQD